MRDFVSHGKTVPDTESLPIRECVSIRETAPIDEKASGLFLRFLYNTLGGRWLLKLLSRPCISKAAGRLMDSRLSACLIPHVARKNHVRMEDFEKSRFDSYNDFFTRKIREGKRAVDFCPSHFIAPCDAKLSAYPIRKDGLFYIKNSYYTIEDLLQNKTLADEFAGGFCLIFRLTVDDYHRYCYIDNGTKGEHAVIPGELHTVQPIALRRYNIYKRNCREYTVLHTAHFGKVAHIEVGAMMIGRIVNRPSVCDFGRGEEKGFFEFGGSTIVLLVKKNAVHIDADILRNSEKDRETVVKFGEKIGEGTLTDAKAANPG